MVLGYLSSAHQYLCNDPQEKIRKSIITPVTLNSTVEMQESPGKSGKGDRFG